MTGIRPLEGQVNSWWAYVAGQAGLWQPAMPDDPPPNLNYFWAQALVEEYWAQDEDLNFQDFDWESDDPEELTEALEIFSPRPTNLSEYRDSGGKLILAAGGSDGGHNPIRAMDYYDELASETDDIDEFFRLFVPPGAGHFSTDGVGPAHADYLTAMEEWFRGASGVTISRRKAG